MKETERKEIALFRYSILSPLISGTWEGEGSIHSFFRHVSTKTFNYPDGTDTKVAASTVERWYYQYKKHGFDGLLPKRRADIGKSRKLDEDIKEQIKYLKEEYRRIPATLIHQKLIENGTIKPKEVSLSTVTRYVNQLALEKKYTNNTDMRRYEREHINEVWCGDSTVIGPRLLVDGKKHKIYIIALLDDASRMVVGVDVFLNDNFINLMSVMKSAVTRYGKPKIFNFDNGKPYKNKQMQLLAARLGSTVNYCAPYTPTSKAKIERWFRTLKDQWMSQLKPNDKTTIDDLRISLWAYVKSYNQTIHHSLNGISPQERFFKEASKIRRLSDEQLKLYFLLEHQRRVSADNVVVLNEVEYEVDYRYGKQLILIRHSPDLKEVYVVDTVTQSLEPLRLLNKHENATIKREKVRFSKEV